MIIGGRRPISTSRPCAGSGNVRPTPYRNYVNRLLLQSRYTCQCSDIYNIISLFSF